MNDLDTNGIRIGDSLQAGLAYMRKSTMQKMEECRLDGQCSMSDLYELWFGLANLNAILEQVVKVLDTTTNRP